MPAGPGPLELTRRQIIAEQAAGDLLRRLERTGGGPGRADVSRRDVLTREERRGPRVRRPEEPPAVTAGYQRLAQLLSGTPPADPVGRATPAAGVMAGLQALGIALQKLDEKPLARSTAAPR